MKPGEFPLQERCDYRKPNEAFAWMMVALPQMRGAALPMSSEYIQMVSEHMWHCGARVPILKHKGTREPKFQEQWWQPPGVGDAHWLTNPGNWRPEKPAKRPGPDMVTMLEAMKRVDEENFFGALDTVLKQKGQ